MIVTSCRSPRDARKLSIYWRWISFEMTVMGEPMEQKRLPLVLLFVADAGGGVADAMVESGEWRVEIGAPLDTGFLAT